MNQEEHKKILQNLTYMKGRLVELDPLIDKLIEKDVFKFEHREQIEAHPTAHRQFNEFIKLLRSSPNKDAFTSFLEALSADGHHALVQKLQSTVPREIGFVKSPAKVDPPGPRQNHSKHHSTANNFIGSRHMPSSSNTLTEPRRFDYEEEARSSTVPSKDSDYSDSTGVKSMLEQFQRKQEALLDKRARDMKNEQKEFIQKNEAIVEAYQSQLQQIQKFFGRWENEKQDLMKSNKRTSDKLQDQMNAFEALKMQYEELKRQYAELKKEYSQLVSSRRPKQENRIEEKGDLKHENEDLKNQCKKLTKENDSLQRELECVQMELQEEKEAYQTLEDKGSEWQSEVERLKALLREKDKECKRLKDKMEKQQAQIKGLMQKQKEAEYFGPQVMIMEDYYGKATTKEELDAQNKDTGYGQKKKSIKKK